MFTRTRSAIPSMLKRYAPESGIRESMMRTLAPRSTSDRAMLLPMNPSPPVIITRRPPRDDHRGAWIHRQQHRAVAVELEMAPRHSGRGLSSAPPLFVGRDAGL